MTPSRRTLTEATAAKDEMQTFSAQVLRETVFMGQPLLVNDDSLSMSAIAFPTTSCTAEAFAASHQSRGFIQADDGRRQSIFLSLDKAYQSYQPFKKVGPSQLECPGFTSSNDGPVNSSIDITDLPQIWPAKEQPSKSGLFITPPTSPRNAVARLPEMTTRQLATIKKAYEAYRPMSIAQSAPNSFEPETKVQDADYNFGDLVFSEPSLELSLQPSSRIPTHLFSRRRFSFDPDTPDDGEYVQAFHRSHPNSPEKQETAPAPEELTRPNCLMLAATTKGNPDYFVPKPMPVARAKGTTAGELVQTPEPVDAEEIGSSRPVPLPTTRFYGNAIYAHGRFVSRRQTPHGTIKLPSHGRRGWFEEPQYELRPSDISTQD